MISNLKVVTLSDTQTNYPELSGPTDPCSSNLREPAVRSSVVQSRSSKYVLRCDYFLLTQQPNTSQFSALLNLYICRAHIHSSCFRIAQSLVQIQPHLAQTHTMEKPQITYSAHEIKRKPIASTPSSSAYQKEISDKPEYDRQATLSTINTQPRSHSLLTRLRTRYSVLSKRTRVLALTSTLLLLALIIGLAAGLSHKRTSNLPLPSSHGGPYTGDLTYYDPALGACGYTNSGSDSICAVSHIIFDAVSSGSNPNANPLCGKKIRVRVGGKSEDLTVVDRCTGCKSEDIDTTRSVFGSLADIDEGRVGVEWAWLEDVPATGL